MKTYTQDELQTFLDKLNALLEEHSLVLAMYEIHAVNTENMSEQFDGVCLGLESKEGIELGLFSINPATNKFEFVKPTEPSLTVYDVAEVDITFYDKVHRDGIKH